MLEAVLILALVYLPGHFLGGRLSRKGDGFSELFLLRVSISLALSAPALTLLALAGRFTTTEILAVFGVFSVAAFFLGRGGENNARATGWDLGAFALMLGSFALYARPAEYVVNSRDPGVYTLLSHRLARTGELLHRDPLVEAVASFHPFLEGRKYPGVFIHGEGLIVPQFFPGPFAFLGLGDLVGGVWGSLFVVPVMGALSVGAAFVLGRELFGRWAGAFGAGILAASYAQIWWARHPSSEVMAQLFVLAGLWLMVRFAREKDAATGIFAGLLLGGAMLLRVDAFLAAIAVPLLFACDLLRSGRSAAASLRGVGRSRRSASAFACGSARSRRESGEVEGRGGARTSHPLESGESPSGGKAKLSGRRESGASRLPTSWRWLYPGIPLALFAVASLAYLNTVGGRYLYVIYSEHGLREAFSFLPLLVGVGLVFLVAFLYVRGRWGRRIGEYMEVRGERFAVFGALCVAALALWAYFVMPVPWESLPEASRDLDAYGSQVVVRMVWFTTPLVAVLALAGLVLAARRPDAGRVLLAGALLGFGVLYVAVPNVAPDLPWATRRFVPAVFPILSLLAGYAVFEAGRWAREVWGHRAGVALAGAMFAAALGWTVYVALPVIPFRELAGAVEAFERVERRIPEAEVVYMEMPDGYDMSASTFEYLHGHPVLPYDRIRFIREKDDLEEADLLADAVYVTTDGKPAPTVSGLPFREVGREEIRLPRLAPVEGHESGLRFEVEYLYRDYRVYRIGGGR